jgi:DNA-binding protein YbaB
MKSDTEVQQIRLQREQMQKQQMQMQQDLQTAEAAGKAAPALKAISE